MSTQPSDNTRSLILETALFMFARDGFDRTTVASIARARGLSDAAVYYHFPTKRHILEALWAEPRGVPAGPPIEEPITDDALRNLNDAAIDFAINNYDLLMLIMREALNRDATAVALRNESHAAWRKTLHSRLAEFDADRDGAATDVVMAAVFGMVFRACIDFGAEFPSRADTPEFRGRVHRAVAGVLPLRLPKAHASA